MISWRRFLALIAAILLTVPAYGLEWYKAYERGRDRIKNGNCSEGQDLIFEALQGNPRDDLKAPTYGTQNMEYFPHYYLALCAFQAKKGADAARYLREAEGGRIASSKLASEYEAMKPQIDAMQKEQQQTTKPPVQTTKPPEEKKPPVVVTPPPEKKPGPTSTVDAKPDNALLIKAILKQTRDALSERRYEDAKTYANSILRLDPANRDARNLLSEIAGKQAEELQANEKQQKIREVQNAMDAGNQESAERLALALKVQYPTDPRIESLLKQIQSSRNSQVDVQKQEEARKNVERDVLMAYYRGDYGQAIRAANLGLPKAPQSWRLHFFLGCSYAALSMLDENGSEDRLRLARESFRRARSLSLTTNLPPYISPKILEIYKSS